MQKIQTRSIEECQELVRQWNAGEHDQVIKGLGAEPTTDFLKSFKPNDTPPPKPLQKLQLNNRNKNEQESTKNT